MSKLTRQKKGEIGVRQIERIDRVISKISSSAISTIAKPRSASISGSRSL
ncbi:MAG TPA: hypothetical protein VN957_00780 [Chthoniobacterales bacterium]|nr:hypothetical protein [Chthoniobacterales bacterium]